MSLGPRSWSEPACGCLWSGVGRRRGPVAAAAGKNVLGATESRRAVHSRRSEDGLNVEPTRRHRSGSMSGRVCAWETNHVGPKRRGTRLVLSRPSLAALVLRLGVLIASVAVVSPTVPRAAPDSAQSRGAPIDLP